MSRWLVLGAVTCSVVSAQSLPLGQIIDDVACKADGSQHYSLYLPSHFTPLRKWSVILAYDAGGRGRRAVERYQAAAEKYGFIIAGSNNSRNGPWEVSLNAANAMTAELLFGLGVEILAPTHDLNAAQVADLARQVGGDRIEAVVYQHLPVFHTEHCVFARFLSTGKSYVDCGRPCEQHRVELRDTSGRAHPVLADVGCRNTVFGAEAQEASAHLDLWRAAGIRHFRLEFVHESGAQVK